MLPYRGRTPSHHIVPVQLHEGVHPEAAPVLPLEVEVREGAVERALALTCGLLPAGVALDALNDLRELAGIQGATAQAPSEVSISMRSSSMMLKRSATSRFRALPIRAKSV